MRTFRMGMTRSLVLVGILALVPPAVAGPSDVEKEIAVSAGARLELDLEIGASVQINGWSRNVVRVEGTVGKVRRRGSSVQIEVERTGQGVRVQTKTEAGKRSHRHSRTPKVELLIRVPERFDVELDSMGGGLSVENVEGTLEGETMGGDLDLRRIHGTVRLKTMGGSISLHDSHVDGSLETMGGEVLFEDVVGDVEGTTMGGAMVYRNVTRRQDRSNPGAISLSTMGGEIVVDDAPHGAHLQTLGGSIHIRSSGGRVKARTNGGDIRIERLDGSVEGTTMAGDIEVVMAGNPGSGARQVDLISYGGDIDLTLPEGLDMKIDIELAYTKDSKKKYRISSDFPIKRRRTAGWDRSEGSPRRHIYGTGTVGSGAGSIHLRTINGNINLKRAR